MMGWGGDEEKKREIEMHLSVLAQKKHIKIQSLRSLTCTGHHEFKKTTKSSVILNVIIAKVKVKAKILSQGKGQSEGQNSKPR